MTNNILALIDFSKSSDKVVERAGELAAFYGAKCWLIHIAMPDPEFVGYDVGPKYVRDHRAGVLKEEHKQLHTYKTKLEGMGVNAEALLIQGAINSTIKHEVKKLEIDMIILGTHGRSRMYNLVVGSVCEYLLRHSPVPLVVIPGR
jgi:nucleotide-binding universal stress UspA family protein